MDEKRVSEDYQDQSRTRRGRVRLRRMGQELCTSFSLRGRVWSNSMAFWMRLRSLASYSRKVSQSLSDLSNRVAIFSLQRQNRFSPLVLGMDWCAKLSFTARISYYGDFSLVSTSLRYWWAESDWKECDLCSLGLKLKRLQLLKLDSVTDCRACMKSSRVDSSGVSFLGSSSRLESCCLLKSKCSRVLRHWWVSLTVRGRCEDSWWDLWHLWSRVENSTEGSSERTSPMMRWKGAWSMVERRCRGRVRLNLGLQFVATLGSLVTRSRQESRDSLETVLKGENFFLPTRLLTLTDTDLQTRSLWALSRGLTRLLLSYCRPAQDSIIKLLIIPQLPPPNTPIVLPMAHIAYNHVASLLHFMGCFYQS